MNERIEKYLEDEIDEEELLEQSTQEIGDRFGDSIKAIANENNLSNAYWFFDSQENRIVVYGDRTILWFDPRKESVVRSIFSNPVSELS